jgi:hypothetical protein
MVHLEQHHFGKASRNGYHNKQWAAWMERIGLMPSNTGEPGGKRTGQRMSHYILPDGAFARAFKARTFEDLHYDREELLGHVPVLMVLPDPPAIPRYRRCVYVDDAQEGCQVALAAFLFKSVGLLKPQPIPGG